MATTVPTSETFLQLLLKQYPPDRFIIRWRIYSKGVSAEASKETPDEVGVAEAMFITYIQVDLAKSTGAGPALPPLVKLDETGGTNLLGANGVTALQPWSTSRWVIERSFAWPRRLGQVGDTLKSNLKLVINNPNADAVAGTIEIGGYEVVPGTTFR